MAAVLLVTPYLFPTPPQAPVAKKPTADSLTTGASGATASGAAATGATATASAMGAAATTDSTGAQVAPVVMPVDTATVKTAVADYRTTNKGAALIGASLTNYQALSNGGRTRSGTVELALPNERMLAFRLVVPGDTVDLGKQVFRSQQTQDGANTVVRYDADLPGKTVSITYSFLPDSFRVNVSATVAGVPENSYLLVDLPTGFRSNESDPTEDHRHLAYAYKPELDGAEGIAFSSLDPGEREIDAGPITWGVAKSKYFILGVLTPKGGTPFAEINVTGGPRMNDEATRGQATLVTPLKAGNAAFEVYVGPQEFKRLLALGRQFETSNPYGGWILGIVQPFATMVIRLLLWMKATLGLSYGWILVIFGVAIRILLWPLNQRAMRSQMAMQRIQPEMQAIQQRYKNDPQKQQQAMMQMYKEHGMSPFSSLSGCLPMLIPLPVFFALFFVFQNTIEFRGVSFLWFPDISVKDPYYIIPILVAATTMLMSWIGMRGMKSDPNQKTMMYVMPAVMLVFFFSMASGLNLYYFIQNLASLPQQWLISQERRKPIVRG
jgi:YidC/Oxa1 family membrane protein insertase